MLPLYSKALCSMAMAPIKTAKREKRRVSGNMGMNDVRLNTESRNAHTWVWEAKEIGTLIDDITLETLL